MVLIQCASIVQFGYVKTLALLSHSLSRTLLLQTSTAGSTDNMSVGPDLLSSGTAVVLFECAGE